MGGQDGYSRDMLTYDTVSNTYIFGVSSKPNDNLKIGFDVTYTTSDAAMRQFDLSAPDFVATHPSTAYDFSNTHMNSDLDMTRVEFDVYGKYKFNETFWTYLRYRVADFEDNAPWMYDTSGSVYFLTGAFGMTF